LQPAHRLHAPDLRQSDALSLGVLVPDLLRWVLVHFDGATLAGLFALSEGPAGLPGGLRRDLDAFARARERELFDLPDGDALQAVLADLAALPSGAVPARLREAIRRRGRRDGDSPATAALLARLGAAWEAVQPDPVVLPSGPVWGLPVSRPAVPDRLKAPDERTGRRLTSQVPRPPAPVRDERRDVWIREEVLDRLDAHREQGLKESVLVAGAVRRSPWPDLEESEVLAVLKVLRQEGEVRATSGRWIRVKRLGW